MQRREKNYFLTQAAFFSFSFLLQSTFLSSILPPPWAPAKAGIETIMNADARKAIAIFIETPWCNMDHPSSFVLWPWQRPSRSQGLALWASRACLVCLAFIVCGASPLSAQERFQPAASAVVLPASVHAGGGSAASLRELDKAWRAQPRDLTTAMAYARAVFILGLKEGDLRWYGSAKAAMVEQHRFACTGLFCTGLDQARLS